MPYTVLAADIYSNTFTVSNGVIDAVDFNAHVVGAGDVITWELLIDNLPAQYLLANDGFGYSVDNTAITYTPVSTTPLPAAVPLFVSGLGALGLFGWCRKRKSAAIAAS